MYKKLIRPILFNFDPEIVHHTSMNLFTLSEKLGLNRIFTDGPVVKDSVRINNLVFPNKLGLAAGFDKNGQWTNELSNIGFGHIEVGTVTPLPQEGNPKPRLFRIPQNEAIINRMGFNNCGVRQMKKNLSNRKYGTIIGANIGKNKSTPNEEAFQDYVDCFTELYESVDYFTINVSSPNTPGLRDLLHKESLEKIFSEITKTRTELNDFFVTKKSIFVKISPDMDNIQIEHVIQLCFDYGIDGIVATNTTIDHSQLTTNPNQQGGLSGKLLGEKSNKTIKFVSDISQQKIPIIGVGGVFNKDDYQKKLDSGATLVQIYTGLIYEGPKVVKNILF